MTLVQLKNKPAEKTFNNFMDGFFYDLPSIFRDDFTTPGFRQFAPVNINETEKEYLLEVIAPGLEKEDFKINLENNILTISAEKKNEIADKNEKNIRKEYKYPAFKRSFTIDENVVDASAIGAKYLNGVLTLNLPKKVEVKEAAKQIEIQ